MYQYDQLEAMIVRIDNELFDLVKPYRHLVDKLIEIPGIEEVLAIGILAESTDDMTNFDDERKYAAWAGVASGNNESAKKKKEPSAARATRTSGAS